MALLTTAEKTEIMKRRGYKSDKSGNRNPGDNLVVHHKDRNPNNNDPTNLRLLTKKEHQDLHARSK